MDKRFLTFAFFVIFLSIYIGSRSSAMNWAIGLKANSNFKVVFQKEPPYVIAKRSRNGTKDRNGLLYDLVETGLVHCFRQYDCNTKNIRWKEVSTEDNLSSSILNETADIAFPIAPSLSSSLTQELEESHDYNVTLVGAFNSPGLAMVIDYNSCKKKIQKLTTDTILSAWPICAVMLLLAAISGISVWALVSGFHFLIREGSEEK